MKKGDKVICIDEYLWFLESGRQYIVSEVLEEGLIIIAEFPLSLKSGNFMIVNE
jgi:hypothetical protein